MATGGIGDTNNNLQQARNLISELQKIEGPDTDFIGWAYGKTVERCRTNSTKHKQFSRRISNIISKDINERLQKQEAIAHLTTYIKETESQDQATAPYTSTAPTHPPTMFRIPEGGGFTVKTQEICEALKQTKDSDHVLLVSGPSDMINPKIYPDTALGTLEKEIKNTHNFDMAQAIKDLNLDPNKANDVASCIQLPQPNPLNLKHLVLVPINKQMLTEEKLGELYEQAGKIINPLLKKCDQRLFISPLATGGKKPGLLPSLIKSASSYFMTPTGTHGQEFEKGVPVLLQQLPKLCENNRIVEVICSPKKPLGEEIIQESKDLKFKIPVNNTRVNRIFNEGLPKFVSGQAPETAGTRKDTQRVDEEYNQTMPSAAAIRRSSPLALQGITITQLPGLVQDDRGRWHSEIFGNKRKATQPIGSLNAGDQGLYTGGGGINLVFGRQIKGTPKQYTSLHKDQINKTSLRSVRHEARPNHPAVRHITTYHDDLTHQNDNTGTVFIEVFNEKDYPNDHKNNRAMIYVVPPKGSNYDRFLDDVYKADGRFLDDVEQTAENIVSTLAQYNSEMIRSDKPEDVIPVLRLCAFSSEIFGRKNIPHDVLVGAINRGIERGFKNNPNSMITELQYSHSMNPGKSVEMSHGMTQPPTQEPTTARNEESAIKSDEGIMDPERLLIADVNDKDISKAKRMLGNVIKSGVIKITTQSDIKALPDDLQDNILKEPFNESKEGEVLEYILDNKKHYALVSAVVECLNHTGCFNDVTNVQRGQIILKLDKKTGLAVSALGEADIGDCPNGTAKLEIIMEPCPGFEGNPTFMATFHIPDGSLEDGTTYEGTTRKCYVPVTEKGKNIMKMLMLAWQNRLLFTVGTSRTSDKENVVTFADIHLKTISPKMKSVPKDKKPFGYPDAGYLNRVEGELKDKRVTMKTAKVVNISANYQNIGGMKIKGYPQEVLEAFGTTE